MLGWPVFLGPREGPQVRTAQLEGRQQLTGAVRVLAAELAHALEGGPSLLAHLRQQRRERLPVDRRPALLDRVDGRQQRALELDDRGLVPVQLRPVVLVRAPAQIHVPRAVGLEQVRRDIGVRGRCRDVTVAGGHLLAPALLVREPALDGPLELEHLRAEQLRGGLLELQLTFQPATRRVRVDRRVVPARQIREVVAGALQHPEVVLRVPGDEPLRAAVEPGLDLLVLFGVVQNSCRTAIRERRDDELGREGVLARGLGVEPDRLGRRGQGNARARSLSPFRLFVRPQPGGYRPPTLRLFDCLRGSCPVLTRRVGVGIERARAGLRRVGESVVWNFRLFGRVRAGARVVGPGRQPPEPC